MYKLPKMSTEHQPTNFVRLLSYLWTFTLPLTYTVFADLLQWHGTRKMNKLYVRAGLFYEYFAYKIFHRKEKTFVYKYLMIFQYFECFNFCGFLFLFLLPFLSCDECPHVENGILKLHGYVVVLQLYVACINVYKFKSTWNSLSSAWRM